MPYLVKDIFHSLQGEGVQAGRTAVFIRFAGCNLWNGREADRGQATCRFCDTDFTAETATRFADADTLARAAMAQWVGGGRPLVICTGGEPALQLDQALLGSLHDLGVEVAIETNGTRDLPGGIDWITVSPKAGAALAVLAGDELKLVFPQESAPPQAFEGLAFSHFVLQPMDGPDLAANTQAAIEYCLAHPRWRLGLQTHKMLGIA